MAYCNLVGATCLAAVISLAGSTLAAQSSKTPNTLALDDPANMPKASAEDLAWLVGHWTGEGLGGEVEEIWTPARGGSMLGMFRMTRNREPVFYELLTVMPRGESLVLRVKHFTPEFVAWEDKEGSVDFPLVRFADSEAFFSGLTLRKVDPDTLKIHLAMRGRDGTIREEEFTLRRNGPADPAKTDQ